MTACKNCGSTQVDEDGAHGYTICMGCGNVLEDQIIVSESQFAEGGGGRKHLMGSIVTDDGSVIGGSALPSKWGCHKNYQRRIVEEATRVMVCIANRLKLAQQHIDSAVMFYKMALSKRILQGKRKSQVCAACLYIVCRTEHTPHILLDFSEIIRENMFQLLRVYTRLCNALCIKLPAADPCLFINRYAQRLQLGEKSDPICVTAMRLVSRMKRDWMATGRRPSSLCGAALVVACRLHGCNRQIGDIAKIVRNASSTINKRLKEFSETASSKLSIEEFENVDLGEEEDPPAFKALKVKSKTKEVEMEEVMQEVSDYKVRLEQEITAEIEGLDSSSLYQPPQFSPETPSCSTSASGTSTSGQGIRTAYGIIPNYVDGETTPSQRLPQSLDKSRDINSSSGDNTSTTNGDDKTEGLIQPLKMENIIKQEIEENVFSDVDDSEIEMLILTPREIEIKQKRWEESDLDEFLAERQRKKDEKLEEERRHPKRKYRRAQRAINAAKGVSATPGEAMEKMIKEKKLSSKINYDVLKKLGSECDATIDRLSREADSEEMDQKKPRITSPDHQPSSSERHKIEDEEEEESGARARHDSYDDEDERSRVAPPRPRYDTVNSDFAAEEEDDFLNYNEDMALHDALQNYSAEEEN